MPDRVREFRDPIHNFISVFPHEKRVIDTFAFQRLRRIRQLALTSYVYHGAEHSRFGHSLGVMHLAGQATERLLDQNEPLIRSMSGWTEGELRERKPGIIRLARLAGLLHDVGHAPFSHAGERRLFSSVRHEQYSAKIVELDEIGSVVDEGLQEFGMNRSDVASLLRGSVSQPAYGFVRQLLDSPYDVDKMDYLLRDSHYCGVQYGVFDINRLIGTLALNDDDEAGTVTLAIESGGQHALEALVIARYFMFTQVYFHKVRRAYDLILTGFIQEVLQSDTGADTYPDVSDIDSYLSWDDDRVLKEAVARADEVSKNTAWMITRHRHPKTAFETMPHPDRMEARTALRRLLPQVRNQFPDIRFWQDAATDHPERYRQEDIPIKVRETPPAFRSFIDSSAVLKGLQEIGQVRLYAFVENDDDLLAEINQFCRNLMA